MTITTRDHYLDVDPYPRSATDPAEVTVLCGCGLELGFDQEGAAGGIQINPQALFDEHMTEVEATQ